MSFKEKINDLSHIIFLILCLLILVLGFMILRLPESSCDINDIQTLTRISQTIKHTNGSYPSIPPADDVVELGDNITCGDSGGGYTGDYMYPGHKNYILGKETGETKIQFVPMTFPDRCIVYYNNKPVIDTGYRGYNRDQQGQEIYYNTICVYWLVR